jgi:predicted nucleotidyltransferase
MSSTAAKTLAPHVEAAKRLLRELERHADSAIDTLNNGDGGEFLSAIQERDTLLTQLSRVVDLLNQERVHADARGPNGRETAETKAIFGDLARAATGVLASHERLVMSTTAERDRLAAVVRRAEQPDTVANQYAVTAPALRAGILSVTG